MDEKPPPDDYGLVAPISLPRDGLAPTELSGPDEYDSFFRIQRDDVPGNAWVIQTLEVTHKVADDLRETSLDGEERADLLDGLTLLLQHALTIATGR
jgi:hypothetical protein